MRSAKGYGLENESNLDAYFQLNYTDGKLSIESKMKELLKMDEQVFKKDLIPQQQSLIKKLAAQETDKNRSLLLADTATTTN